MKAMKLHMHNGELYSKDQQGRLSRLVNATVIGAHISSPDPDLEITCTVLIQSNPARKSTEPR